MDQIKGLKINSAGYGTIPKLVMQDRNLNVYSKAIYAYFCSYTGAGDTCFPSRDKICYDLNISRGAYQKYLKALIERGYVTAEQQKTENGGFSHNVYTVKDIVDFTVAHETVHGETVLGDTVHGGTVHREIGANNNSLNNNNLNNNSNNNIGKKSASRFIPPTIEEVRSYCSERKNNIDPQRFIDYYQSNGWKVGKNPMKDWQAAVRTWERSSGSYNKQAATTSWAGNNPPGYDEMFGG